NFRLQTVMLGLLPVAAFHVKEREIRVDELFLGAKRLGLVAFGNRGRKITLTVISHAEGELRVEVRGISRQHGPEPGDGPVEIAPAEIKHRVVVLLLRSHANPQRHATHNGGLTQATDGFSRKDNFSKSLESINGTYQRLKCENTLTSQIVTCGASIR